MMKKFKKRVKYQDGGLLDGETSTDALLTNGTGDPKPAAKKTVTNPPTTTTPPSPTGPLSPQQLKSRYKDNPYLVGGGNNRYFWATQTNREFPLTGGNVGEAVKNAATLNKLDPAILYASAMEEGMSGAIDTKNWENASEAYVDWANANPKLGEKFQVDGFYNYGLDQFPGQVKTLQQKGYLPKDFQNNYTTFAATNEKKEKITTAAFDTDANALIAKSAMLRLSQDQLDNYIKKTGTNLTDKQREFFILANYNGGEGNMQKMLESYKQKGYLKDDKFLESTFKPESYGSIYNNVMARIQSANMLRSEGIFAYGGKIPQRPKGVPKYENGTPDPIDPITGLPVFTPTGNQTNTNTWGNLSTGVPSNPNALQAFRTDNQGTPTQNNGNVVPLSQFYNTVDIGGGNQGLQSSGQYVNAQGETTTPQDQQQIADQISNQNRQAAMDRERQMGDIEMVSSASIAAINSFLQRNNQGQQNRTNRRDVLMREIIGQEMNPYVSGTGSQAIMKNGGKIHIKKENRGKFTAAAKRAGMGVQAYANKIMANPDNYSSTLVKRANFARNAAKWHEFGGKIDDDTILGEDVGIQTLDGGHAKVISTSDHSNPMVEFSGREHSQGGIGLQYGGNIAEVEDKEVAWVDDQGSLNIFGKLKLPGSNMTFRKAAEDIAAQEAKIDGKKSKYLNIMNNSDKADPYQETAINTSKVMFKSLDKQSKQIAEKKEALASYQNLILGMVNQGQMERGGKLYPNGGKVLEKTGERDPLMARRLAALGELPNPDYNNLDPQNFNTGDFQFSSQLINRGYQPNQTVQNPQNFNTGDFQFSSQLTNNGYTPSIPQSPMNFNTGDFEFTGGVTMINNSNPGISTRTTRTKSGDFESNNSISTMSADEFRRRRVAEALSQGVMFKNGGVMKYEIGGELTPEQLKKLQESIGQFESSGNYKARGQAVTKGQYKGQRALGKYQVMPGNLANWSKEALGKEISEEEFLNNPNLQDQIVGYQLNRINKQYPNAADIASVWFSGRPAAGNTSRDVTGTSVPTYISAVMRNYGGMDQPVADQSVAKSNTSPNKVTTDGIMNFKPVYGQVPGNGAGAVKMTPYGAAAKDPTPLSDKANVSSGSKQRGYQSPLAFEQIAPELLSIATNQRETPQALSYQPDLLQTFDISYQLGRNENQSTFNQASALAQQSGNIDALYQLAAQKYKADQAYNMQEIQGNAQNRLQTYAQNVNTMNDAQMKNLAFIADQTLKQAQSNFNTQQQDMAAIRSISGKVQQNRLENTTYNAYANLFKHYGFDKRGNVVFEPDKVTQRFSPGEAQAFGMMAAQQGANAILNGDFSRQFTKVKNADGSQTTTETLGTNKKIQEEYKSLKAQGFDDMIIGNMLKAKYPETISQ